MERHYFRERQQEPGETICDYVANSLKGLAAKCEYGDLNDAMIRDQVTSRTWSARIRERLLLEPDTATLEKIVELACHIEKAIKESKVMGGACDV